LPVRISDGLTVGLVGLPLGLPGIPPVWLGQNVDDLREAAL